MPVTDTRSANRNYPVPVSSNKLKDDQPRLAVTVSMIDEDVQALFDAIETKAALVHEHEIVHIAGLQSALDGKALFAHSHALNDLSDVDVTGAAANQVVMRVGTAWVPATIQIGHVSGLEAAINAKAPSASPAFTGTPTAPTAAPGTNTTQLATTAFVIAVRDQLLNSPPGALDTLDELAAALGDDPNFAATMAALIATKAALNSPAFTGTPTAPTAGAGTNTTQVATTAFVQEAVAARAQCYLSRVGANLVLSRDKGKLLFINGKNEVIPSAGVSYGPPTIDFPTRYFIYAYMNAGVMTLEHSSTGHATDATHGHEIKSGDASRSLVGMAIGFNNAWETAPLAVLSWFNRRLKADGPTSLGNVQLIGQTYPTTAPPEYVQKVLNWGDEVVRAYHDGQAVTIGTGTGGHRTYVDATSGVMGAAQFSTAANSGPAHVGGIGRPTEGVHTYGLAMGDAVGTPTSVNLQNCMRTIETMG